MKPQARRVMLAVLFAVGVAVLATVLWAYGAPFGTRQESQDEGRPLPTQTEGERSSTPPPKTDPVLVGAGDIGRCRSSGDEATAALLDRFAGATVFTAGDNAYPRGTAEDFTRCYDPSWGRFKDRTRPAAGNHEYETTDANGYFSYFGAAAGERGKGYYSYNLGAWHVVVLNSNCGDVGGCGVGSPQERWLRADLRANPRDCTLAYWHHPRFSSGQHGNSRSVQAFWDALYDFGADVVVSGHDHMYEVFAPQDPRGEADPKGIRQFVVGTGGASHYDFDTVEPNSVKRIADTFGVLALTLHATGYDWQFVPVPGGTGRDAGTGKCVTGAR